MKSLFSVLFVRSMMMIYMKVQYVILILREGRHKKNELRISRPTTKIEIEFVLKWRAVLIFHQQSSP